MLTLCTLYLIFRKSLPADQVCKVHAFIFKLIDLCQLPLWLSLACVTLLDMVLVEQPSLGMAA